MQQVKYYIDVDLGPARVETVGPLPKDRVAAFIRSKQSRFPHARFTVLSEDSKARYHINHTWGRSISEYRRQESAKQLLCEACEACEAEVRNGFAA